MTGITGLATVTSKDNSIATLFVSLTMAVFSTNPVLWANGIITGTFRYRTKYYFMTFTHERMNELL